MNTVSLHDILVLRLAANTFSISISPTSDFDVLQLPTTTIIKDHIERFTEKGIIAGGIERECDVIIKATGFNVDYNPTFTVTGRNGVTLQKAWEEYPFTYRSVMSSGFPNLFHCMGPNAPVALSR
jgi:cation diffusion facilitator CzcD-associated flavoprotein CzcO